MYNERFLESCVWHPIVEQTRPARRRLRRNACKAIEFFRISKDSAEWTVRVVPKETVVPWGVPGANARAGLVY